MKIINHSISMRYAIPYNMVFAYIKLNSSNAKYLSEFAITLEIILTI